MTSPQSYLSTVKSEKFFVDLENSLYNKMRVLMKQTMTILERSKIVRPAIIPLSDNNIHKATFLKQITGLNIFGQDKCPIAINMMKGCKKFLVVYEGQKNIFETKNDVNMFVTELLKKINFLDMTKLITIYCFDPNYEKVKFYDLPWAGNCNTISKSWNSYEKYIDGKNLILFFSDPDRDVTVTNSGTFQFISSLKLYDCTIVIKCDKLSFNKSEIFFDYFNVYNNKDDFPFDKIMYYMMCWTINDFYDSLKDGETKKTIDLKNKYDMFGDPIEESQVEEYNSFIKAQLELSSLYHYMSYNTIGITQYDEYERKKVENLHPELVKDYFKICNDIYDVDQLKEIIDNIVDTFVKKKEGCRTMISTIDYIFTPEYYLYSEVDYEDSEEEYYDDFEYLFHYNDIFDDNEIRNEYKLHRFKTIEKKIKQKIEKYYDSFGYLVKCGNLKDDLFERLKYDIAMDIEYTKQYTIGDVVKKMYFTDVIKDAINIPISFDFEDYTIPEDYEKAKKNIKIVLDEQVEKCDMFNVLIEDFKILEEEYIFLKSNTDLLSTMPIERSVEEYVNDLLTVLCVYSKTDPDVINKFIEKNIENIDLNCYDDFIFKMACHNGNLECVKYLLNLEYNNININASNDFAFRYACINGHYDIVSYLLAIEGNNIDIEKNLKIMRICQLDKN